MREETDQNFKAALLDYLISLLDANDFSWASAQASHAVLLCHMEQGEIKDYTQTEQIDRIRCVHMQRQTPTGQDTQKNVSKQNNSKSVVCQYYNLGVGPPSACKFPSRYIWSTTTYAKQQVSQEFLANKDTYLSWFRSFKAFDNRHDGRTYAQFLLHSHNLSILLTHHIAARVLASWRLNKRMQMLNLLPPPRLV